MGDTATVEPTELDIDFEALFESAAAAEPATEELPPDEPEVVAEAEPEVEEPAAPEPTAEEPAEPEPEVAEPEKEPEPEPPKKEEPVDIQAAVNAEVERRLQEQRDRDAAAKEESDREAERLAAESYTQEEQDLMAAIANDFAADSPKVFAAIERVAVAKATNMFEKQMAEFEQKFSSQLSPIQQTVATSSQDAFDRDLKAAHADAYDIMPKIEKWVTTQPGYMQAAYNAVLDGKTSNPLQDTISLITTVKESLGLNKPAAPEPPPVPPEKQEKIEQQEGIRSRASQNPLGGVDDSDDEALFERFATK